MLNNITASPVRRCIDSFAKEFICESINHLPRWDETSFSYKVLETQRPTTQLRIRPVLLEANIPQDADDIPSSALLEPTIFGSALKTFGSIMYLRWPQVFTARKITAAECLTFSFLDLEEMLVSGETPGVLKDVFTNANFHPQCPSSINKMRA